MAKRFTDTEKWKKPFIRGLEAPYKLLWFYLLDECDHAGIWDVDIEVAEIKTGTKIDLKKALIVFKGKIFQFGDGGKWFIPSFIDFQYGVLNSENRAHRSVLDRVNKYGLTGLLMKGEAPCKPLTSTLEGAMDMDMDKDKDKEGGVGETKKKQKKPFEPPTVEQVVEYFKENGFSEVGAKKAHEHYRLANWHDTHGKPVLAWKQKIHTNWFKDEFRINGVVKKATEAERPPKPHEMAEWDEEKQHWLVDHEKFRGI